MDKDKEPPCCNDPIYVALMLHGADVEKAGERITKVLGIVAGAIVGLILTLGFTAAMIVSALRAL